MELDPYVATLRDHLLAAAAVGGDAATAAAQRLVVSLEAAARLALIEALSHAADDLTTQIVPGTVELRLRGGDPQLVVRLPDQRFEAPRLPEDLTPAGAASAASGEGSANDPGGPEGAVSRISLRLPDHLKSRAEAAAAADGVSLNAWLTAVVATAVAGDSRGGPGEPDDRWPRVQRGGSGRSRYTGWAH